MQEEALRDYPAIARALLSFFACKFDPAHGGTAGDRAASCAELTDKITAITGSKPNLGGGGGPIKKAAGGGGSEATTMEELVEEIMPA